MLQGRASYLSLQLKSDQNGIEIRLSDPEEEDCVWLKSDQNGIEIEYYLIEDGNIYWLKSDQNGIEIVSVGTPIRCRNC